MTEGSSFFIKTHICFTKLGISITNPYSVIAASVIGKKKQIAIFCHLLNSFIFPNAEQKPANEAQGRSGSSSETATTCPIVSALLTSLRLLRKNVVKNRKTAPKKYSANVDNIYLFANFFSSIAID